ncbi:pilus assembly PilX family protein [Catenovulum sediminis]|uniref:Pilus assembly PilX N-terminal domain-containing protein n=1 Tax=Catenovulum sediminis TaxID=1740262 RepID=A0ABV1RMK6_9ALTE|nr:hypothetical protein [Catenovulum sediminis]
MAQLIQLQKIHSQQGAALAVALVLMLVLTSLAVTLLYNTSLDTKMAHATVIKKSSLNATLGGSDEFINKAHNRDALFAGVNPLTGTSDVNSVSLSGENLNGEAEALTDNPTNCPHFSRTQASDSYIRCTRFEIKVQHQFGQNEHGRTEVVTAVASQIPGES